MQEASAGRNEGAAEAKSQNGEWPLLYRWPERFTWAGFALCLLDQLQLSRRKFSEVAVDDRMSRTSRDSAEAHFVEHIDQFAVDLFGHLSSSNSIARESHDAIVPMVVADLPIIRWLWAT